MLGDKKGGGWKRVLRRLVGENTKTCASAAMSRPTSADVGELALKGLVGTAA